MVQSGKTTWEALAAVGMAELPEDAFTRAFRKKQEENQDASD
jgi:hypothetical protein